MKHLLLVLALLLLTLGAAIDDYLLDMKTTKEKAQNFIQESIGYGSFSYPSACRTIPQSKRAAIVRAVGEFAKQVVATDAFGKWYTEYRDHHKPSPPEMMKSMEEARKEQIVAVKAQIAEQEKAYASAPAEQKAIFKDVIAAMKKSLKELENTDKSKDATMDSYVQQANATAKQEYQQKLADFERDYPVGNSRPLLKRRLQQFMEATAGVDFNAKLVKKGKVMVFENEEYENKDGNWKMAYRAGKEATQAARAFAETWLKQL